MIASGDHAGDRSFCVKGKVVDDEDKLSLRLRIGHTEHGGDHPFGHGFASLYHERAP